MKSAFFSRYSAYLAFACLWTATVKAQNYAIDWFTIDGGGGSSSTGGGFALSGTAGQPDAGTASGGAYTLVGGFWGIIEALQTPGASGLSIIRSGSVVAISWPRPSTGFVLERTGLLTSPPAAIPWSPVPPGSYQTNSSSVFITVPAPVGNQFYRLRRP